MYEFKYHRPTTVRQAANLLAKNAEAKLLAGGHSLIPVMKLRLAKPSDLIDLEPGRRPRPASSCKGRSIVIGAMTRHADVANSQVVKDALPVLAEVPGSIGDPAVRHRGTIGGSLANNDPNADYPAAVLGLGATIITNKRRIAADDFFKGMFETALEPDEIITKVQFPIAKKAAYEKFKHPASGFALVGVFVSQARRRHPRRGDRRGLERRVPREELRGGAEEALLAEVDRGHDDPGRRHELATSTAAPNTARIWSPCWRAGRWRRRSGRGCGDLSDACGHHARRHARPCAGHRRFERAWQQDRDGRDKAGHDGVSCER